MNFQKVDLEGVLRIQPRKFEDERGFFTERYNQSVFREIGIDNEFIQDNYSFSREGVVRGLHFQTNPAQGKLVTVVSGKIRDVVVDLRKNSKTFGRSVSFDLDAAIPEWIWIPAGFAHGFSVLSAEAGVLYKVDSRYSPTGEGGIRWDDPDLDIDWGVKNPIISAKDRVLPDWKTYKSAPVF